MHERLSKYQVMLEEQQGTNYQLSGELAAKEEQILQLKQALDLRKASGAASQPFATRCSLFGLVAMKCVSCLFADTSSRLTKL